MSPSTEMFGCHSFVKQTTSGGDMLYSSGIWKYIIELNDELINEYLP